MLQGFKAELFKALGHPVRIRILELLRGGERTVTELQVQLQIIGPSVSQQLAVLRGRQLVASRKEGTNVYYRVADPRVYDLLDTARAIFESHVATLQTMMEGADATLANEETMGDTVG